MARKEIEVHQELLNKANVVHRDFEETGVTRENKGHREHKERKEHLVIKVSPVN